MSLQLAERTADAIRERHPEAQDIPVDLPAMARALGVDRITYMPLVEDGRLETDATRTEILVSTSANGYRQRFTIAHEVAHLLLTRPGQAAVERRLSTDDDVERFCDQFAAALLLPREWVASRFGHAPRTLATVRQLSAISETSLAASVVRLQQTANWSSMLMQWRRDAGAWRFRWGAGVPSALYGRIRATDATRRMFDEIGRTPNQDVRVNLPLQVRGEHGYWRAIVSCRGGSALALVEYA